MEDSMLLIRRDGLRWYFDCTAISMGESWSKKFAHSGSFGTVFYWGPAYTSAPYDKHASKLYAYLCSALFHSLSPFKNTDMVNYIKVAEYINHLFVYSKTC